MPDPTPTLDNLPDDIDPYQVLSLPKTATAAEIRTSYRKLALQHHPDKPAGSHDAFQTLAFAYAILSEPTRRARYDTTGSTDLDGGGDGDAFDWADFFKAQFQAVSAEAVEEFRREFQGSKEERTAILTAYTTSRGDLDAVFAEVMVSDVTTDEARFRTIIDAAIASREVHAFPAYTRESAAKARRRRADAKREAAEAEEAAKHLGLRGDTGEESLKALIRGRAQGRLEDVVRGLERKYAPPPKEKKGRKKKAIQQEPTEEEFEALKAKVEGKRKRKEQPLEEEVVEVRVEGKGRKRVAPREPTEEEFEAARARLGGGRKKRARA